MKLGRVGASLVFALTIGLVFGGCVVFQGQVRVKQVGDKPKVAVKFKLCNSDGESTEPRCPSPGNSGDDGFGVTATGEQVLLGFRVRRGTELPERIRAKGDDVPGAFRPLNQYTEALNDLAPTRDGYRWFGYSAPPAGDDQGNDSARLDLARFKVIMRVPDDVVGKRFAVRPVVGWYDDHDIQDGLDCGPDPFVYYGDANGENTICIDSPTRDQTRNSIKTKIEPKAG